MTLDDIRQEEFDLLYNIIGGPKAPREVITHMDEYVTHSWAGEHKKGKALAEKIRQLSLADREQLARDLGIA